ncbi:GDSL-like Lipase/Acylhydrolase superfamily protein [Striga asiatica]|uniref:GDSL-like Lipase/Acylhydrolase superfamily protein n=1 Tax=Striga asiatica TaxID=4170 RepID=A0A5A7R3W4_STRAF|nr:GDSL-like Lipase/Acylhydrolase superfamily protein [Striga asiatica]
MIRWIRNSRVIIQQHVWQTREIRVGFTFVHVLFAIEDDYVVVTHDFECHQDFLVFLGEIAKHEFDVDPCPDYGLRPVDESEEVPLLVLIGNCQDPDQYPHVVVAR